MRWNETFDLDACPACTRERVTIYHDTLTGVILCVHCIGEEASRRAELDAYLAGLESHGQARVIRVGDLGKALEAEHEGKREVSWATYAHRYIATDEDVSADRESATRAAHLARQALGESS